MIHWTRELLGPAGGNVFKYGFIIVIPFAASLAFSALVYRKFSLPILQYGRAKKSAGK